MFVLQANLQITEEEEHGENMGKVADKSARFFLMHTELSHMPLGICT